jgi:hypothetical protein
MAMSKTSDKKGEVWKPVVTAVVVALLAGGTAPWWWERLFDAGDAPTRVPHQQPPERAEKRTTIIPEHNFWLTLPRPVSELRGRLDVQNSGEKITAQVQVVHESGPKKDTLLGESRTALIYEAPSGFKICPLKLPVQSGKNRLGLMQYCKQGNHCSYNFPDAPDSSSVNVRLHSLSVTIVRGTEMCD